MFSQDQVCLISGYDLVCHRAIKVITELAGIEDMYCKTEGKPHCFLMTRLKSCFLKTKFLLFQVMV